MKRPRFLGRGAESLVALYNSSRFTERTLVLMEEEGDGGGEGPLYHEDGLATFHSHAFVDEERFGRAYARAIRAAGFDYRIRWRAHTMLWAASQAAAVEGAFVECGTGRGFMASAVCEYLGWSERSFYLFDTFMPTYPDAEGKQAEEGKIYANYAQGPEQVASNFAEWPGVKLVVGRIPEALVETGPVAFLHIDLNSPAPEAAALEHFWPKLSRGAIVVFDDYGFGGYESQKESADRIAAELGFAILSLPTGQGLVVR